MWDEMLECLNERQAAIGAKLICAMNERIIDRDHLETVEEALGGVEIAKNTILVAARRGFKILLTNVSEVGKERQRDLEIGLPRFLSEGPPILSIGDEILKY